jgi:DNA replication protein DnaC
MLLNTTIDGLKTLRLDAMAAALAEQHEQAAYSGLGFEERLGLLVDRELTERSSRRLERCLKTARLRTPATVEDIDFHHPRGLDRAQILTLAQAHWAQHHQPVVITGPTGAGKPTSPARWPTPPSATVTPRCISARRGCSTTWPSPAQTAGCPA